jgi:hypothetical protein
VGFERSELSRAGAAFVILNAAVTALELLAVCRGILVTAREFAPLRTQTVKLEMSSLLLPLSCDSLCTLSDSLLTPAKIWNARSHQHRQELYVIGKLEKKPRTLSHFFKSNICYWSESVFRKGDTKPTNLLPRNKDLATHKPLSSIEHPSVPCCLGRSWFPVCFESGFLPKKPRKASI